MEGTTETLRPVTALDAATAREVAYDYLHYNGSCTKLLTDAEFDRVYCMCDGFGPVGELALEINGGYDWSHVRDSSDEAIVAVAREIQRLLKARHA